MIVAAEGVWFTDDTGRQVLDGHSGLWTTGLGHGREEIAEAVSQQVRALDFAPPFHTASEGVCTCQQNKVADARQPRLRFLPTLARSRQIPR